jgi:hypothetical protein
VDLNDQELPCIKTLGVWWDAENDVFGYSHTPIQVELITKRTLLSVVARLFDPLQILAPFIIRAKILLQKAWIEGLGWDEPFPMELDRQVREWIEELHLVSQIGIPRCLHRSTPDQTSIHTFTDASSVAYAAAVYVRHVYSDGSISVRIVLAKARVTPLKAISIPRLKLMGALLGLRLTLKVKEILGFNSVHYWTDSMDVVHWIHGQSRHYKPFVSHRVGEIHEYSRPREWRHVPGVENPADLGTRGARVEDLIQGSIWTDGPAFLYQGEEDWPARKGSTIQNLSEAAQLEVTKTKSVAASSRAEEKCSEPDVQMQTAHPIDCKRYSYRMGISFHQDSEVEG